MSVDVSNSGFQGMYGSTVLTFWHLLFLVENFYFSLFQNSFYWFSSILEDSFCERMTIIHPYILIPPPPSVSKHLGKPLWDSGPGMAVSG